MPTEKQQERVRFALLTVSDTRTSTDDRSGDALQQRVTGAGHQLVHRALIRDEADAIEAQLREWLASSDVDVIITTGGTGITGRDVTPEAVRRVLDKELPGFGELFRMQSYAKIGASAIFSRALGGIAGGKYLFALPGSPGAVADAWDGILAGQFDSASTACTLLELMPRLTER